jgi:hypothetical protein
LSLLTYETRIARDAKGDACVVVLRYNDRLRFSQYLNSSGKWVTYGPFDILRYAATLRVNVSRAS